MARVVAARKRARKRLAAKRKKAVVARSQATNSAGPKVTPLRRILYILTAILEICFLFLSIVATIVKTFFRFLSPLLTILQFLFEVLDKFKL
jgi:hypothetical protein